MQRLREKRIEENRPHEVNQLTTEQLVQEKSAIQRALLYFESIFGRPNSREERDTVRFLYDRYRSIKRSLSRSASFSASGHAGLGELPTIHEHEAMQFTSIVEVPSPPAPPPLSAQVLSPTSSVNLSDSMDNTTTATTTTTSTSQENIHQLSIEELWKHLESAREEKKELRRVIKEFEDVFEQQNGRRMLKSDRSVIEETYGLYKQKKAKLRLLDALVKKHMAK